MLQYQAVDSGTLELLKNLQGIDLFQSLRLVGGTALALQLGHRKSIDLDLFGLLDADILEIDRAVNAVGQSVKLRDSKNIHVYLVNGIKVDIVNYSYPWIDELLATGNVRLAGLKDIAAMKLAAITGRGSKKDFVDLFFLLQHMSLQQMLECYAKKFADGSLFLVLKSLVYFEDADTDPMPEMIIPANWTETKNGIAEAHRKYMEGFNA